MAFEFDGIPGPEFSFTLGGLWLHHRSVNFCLITIEDRSFIGYDYLSYVDHEGERVIRHMIDFLFCRFSWGT